jgi:hypothetical protein
MSVLPQGHSAFRSVLIDIILSFAVYLVPLITVHALFPAGRYLMSSASRLAESPGWVALDWIAMLAVQGMLFGLLRAARRLRAIGRTLLRVGAFAAAVPAVNALLLWVIPVIYLVEASTAPEVNLLTEVCHVGGIALPPRVDGLHVDATAAVLPVWREPDYRPALLHVDGCRIEDLEIPNGAEIGNVSPSGAWLWRTRESAQKGQGQWFLTTPSGVTLTQPIAIAGPNTPQILDDGSGVFWVEADPSPRIVVIAEEGTRQIEGPGVPKGSDRVLEGAGPTGPFYFPGDFAHEERWLTMDGDGQVTRSISAPAGVARFGHHLRPLANGWIAWDTYRDQGRYVVTWSADGHTGIRTLSKGLSISSVAFDQRGEYIAISALGASRISNQRDEVWLVRTSDGGELYRRYAPTNSRAVVALPAGRYFAVDDVHDRRSSVRVYDLQSAPSHTALTQH